MPILLDEAPAKSPLPTSVSLGDAIAWATSGLPAGRIVTTVELDGKALDGVELQQARGTELGGRTLNLRTQSRKDLALTTLGKLAALIQWLAPQHKDAAQLLEQGNAGLAFARLGQILAAWQQIQAAYSGLAKLLNITLKELPVRHLTGEHVMNEFVAQLTEIQTALQNHDLVLLADILQYEMDGAVANWMSILEATLGVVEGTVEAVPTA
jgi:hypothetical protein